MKAKKIYLNPIKKLKGFFEFLELSINEQTDFIINSYRYIETHKEIDKDLNKFINPVDSNDASDLDNNIIIKELKDALESGDNDLIFSMLKPLQEDNEDFKGFPTFIFYDKDYKEIVNDDWLIYPGNDALDIYKNDKFSEVIDDLRFTGGLVEKTKYNSNYAIAYTINNFKKDLIGKSIFYYVLFKAKGVEIKNKINEDLKQTLFNINTVKDISFIYFKDGKYNLFSNNNNINLSSDTIKGLLHKLSNNTHKLAHDTKYNSGSDELLNNIHKDIIKDIKGSTEDNEFDNDTQAHGEGGSKGQHSSKKPVVQLDMNNGAIKTWKSATEASEELGISRSSIVKAAKGQQSVAGNFKWKYA